MSAPSKEKSALLHAPSPLNSVRGLAALSSGVKRFPAKFGRKSSQIDTYGPLQLCAWQVVPGVFWIQTTEPQLSRKLEKREDARRVEISGVNHFRRTFELRGTWRKLRRIIDRYLVSAGDQFSPDFRLQFASKTPGSIKPGGGLS